MNPKPKVTACAMSGEIGCVEIDAPDAFDAHHEAFVGIGADDERVLLEPVVGRETPLFCRQKRQDRGEGVDAEVLTSR